MAKTQATIYPKCEWHALQESDGNPRGFHKASYPHRLSGQEQGVPGKQSRFFRDALVNAFRNGIAWQTLERIRNQPKNPVPFCQAEYIVPIEATLHCARQALCASLGVRPDTTGKQKAEFR